MSTELLDAMSPFDEVSADFYGVSRRLAQEGRKVAGFTCSYSPHELFHAAGFVPIRILGRPGNTPLSDRLLQTYACSFARSAYDSALAGELDFLDMVVFAHTCDTMQSLAELWKRQGSDRPMITISTPNLMKGGAAKTFFRKELGRVREEIEKHAGPIADEAITATIALYQGHKAAMQQLYGLRRRHPERLTGQQAMSVVLASLLIPKEDHLKALNALLRLVEAREDIPPLRQPKVLVAGSVCQSMDFLEAIEGAGCTVIDDDLCMGARSYGLPEPGDGDPLDVLVEQYMGRTPCPAFHVPGFDPGKHLLDRVHESGADAVVFLLTKFCDPWAFDYVRIKNVLEEAGVPMLQLEVEQHLPVPEQLRTRAEAFVEMLESQATP